MSALFNLSMKLPPSPFCEPVSILPCDEAVNLAGVAADATLALSSLAKEPEASGGLCEVAPHAVQVGEAGADQPATSEHMDVTGRRDVHQFEIPPGYVLLDQAALERAMTLIAEVQEWQEDYLRLREHMDSWQDDYERLLEKERVELLTPPPAFLANPDFSKAMETR